MSGTFPADLSQAKLTVKARMLGFITAQTVTGPLPSIWAESLFYILHTFVKTLR